MLLLSVLIALVSSCSLGLARIACRSPPYTLPEPVKILQTNQLSYGQKLLRDGSASQDRVVSAYGAADILYTVLYLSEDYHRSQFRKHPLAAQMDADQFVQSVQFVKELLWGCPDAISPDNSPWIALSEVFLRRPFAYDYGTNDASLEFLNWKVLFTFRVPGIQGKGTFLNPMLSNGEFEDVYKLLRTKTKGPEESLVIVNVANLKAEWKLSSCKCKQSMRFRKNGEANFEMVKAFTLCGNLRYRICGNPDDCRKSNLPNMYQLPLRKENGEEFRLTIYQSTDGVSIEDIQKQLNTDSYRKWTLQSDKPDKNTSITIPAVKITTVLDLNRDLHFHNLPTNVEESYENFYAQQKSKLVVKHNLTKVLSVSQIRISQNGISASKDKKALSTQPPTCNSLKVDTSFVFVVEHVSSSIPVMMGRFVRGNT